MSDEPLEYTRDPIIRAFGSVLRAYREHAGLSRPQLAEALGCTPQWIEKLETGKKPSRETAIDLDTFFKIPACTFFHMWEEIERAGRKVAPPPGFSEYLALEKRAAVISKFDPWLISGLFQVEAYARAVLLEYQTPEAAEELLAARMRRKEILTKNNSPRILAMLDERVLRRVLGGKDVMREQLNYLLELSESPRIMIQVVPEDGQHPGAFSDAFTMLDFSDGASAIYTETPGQGILLRNPRAVALAREGYEYLKGNAHHVTDTQRMIRMMVKEL